MPINKKDYPPDWDTVIRPDILRRAGGTDPDPRKGAKCEMCGALNHEPHPITGSRVRLTIAHLNHDVKDNDYSNLKALCEKCHNGHDVAHRTKNRNITLIKKKYKQVLSLFESL